MTGRKRSIATRRKKEERELNEAANQVFFVSKELIAAIWIAAMVASFLKGVALGYFIWKNR